MLVHAHIQGLRTSQPQRQTRDSVDRGLAAHPWPRPVTLLQKLRHMIVRYGMVTKLGFDFLPYGLLVHRKCKWR